MESYWGGGSAGAEALSVMVRVEYIVAHIHNLHVCHSGFFSLIGVVGLVKAEAG